jgi:predicted enzyme related to lactoylglutathione lyase
MTWSARRFYAGALGATISFASPAWTSVHIAGVRIALFLNPDHPSAKTGLHFTVDDLAVASAAIARAGGLTDGSAEVAPGVIIAEATDTERNRFTLRRS